MLRSPETKRFVTLIGTATPVPTRTDVRSGGFLCFARVPAGCSVLRPGRSIDRRKLTFNKLRSGPPYAVKRGQMGPIIDNRLTPLGVVHTIAATAYATMRNGATLRGATDIHSRGRH